MRFVLNAVFALIAVWFLTSPAWAERLLIGVSNDTVPVQSDFSGTSIVVFGAIDDPESAAIFNDRYDVVITVEGPRRDIVVRKKDRIFGIWANSGARPYAGVPSFYKTISKKPLEEVADMQVLRASQIGIDNISLNLVSGGGETFAGPAPEFAASLRRLRRNNGLYSERSRLDFLSSTLFRAYVELPANVPIGDHQVKAFLFKEGQLIDTAQSRFKVAKSGFERMIFEMAHENSLIYGIMAVILAIVTGWSANVIFRKD